MKRVRPNLFILFAMTSMAVMSGCSEEFDPQVVTADDKFRQEYAENFFKHYGTFPENQSWDFSNAPRTAPTDPSIFDLGREGVTRAATRATGHVPEADVEVSLAEAKADGVLKVPSYPVDPESSYTWPEVADPYYYLEEETFNWLKTNLPEGINNTPKGSPFVFKYESPLSDDKRFAIIPFYQGYGNVKYKLHLVSKDQNKDYVIWDNWPLYDGEYTLDAVLQNNAAAQGTEDFQYNYQEKYPAAPTGNWVNVGKDFNLENLVEKNIRSKPMIISGQTGEFYFYLEITQTLPQYGYVGEHQSSREGMMMALNYDAPEHINDYKGLFGVDDSKTINQVMVMGTTVDFDFNDVVVDVTETVVINSDGTEGEVLTQEAVLRHKCGTLPFQVYFVDSDGDKRTFGNFEVMNGEVQGKDAQYTYKEKKIAMINL